MSAVLADGYLVASCGLVAGIFLGEESVVVGIGDEVRRFDFGGANDLDSIDLGVVDVGQREIDLRVLCDGEDWRGGARVEVRLGSEAEVRFGDAGLAARGGSFLRCVSFVGKQWEREPGRVVSEMEFGTYDEVSVYGGDAERQDIGLHDYFSQVAAGQPDAVAVREGDLVLSYRELEGKSDALAKRLMDAGVEAGDVVATFMGRGTRFCVSVLGIVKAGAVYLPIDPEYPGERHRTMLEDGGCKLVLVGEKEDSLSAEVEQLVVDVDELGSEPLAGVAVPRRGGDAAYLIFTSGSTGRPKGVINTHRGAVNEVMTCVEQWELGPGDRLPQFACISFDVAVEEIWTTWLSGAQLVVTPPDVIRSHARFMGWVDENGITVLDLPTAFWHSIVTAVENGDALVPDSLRQVVVGGEFARSSAYESWKELTGGKVRWVNAYGPTEAAIACTFFRDWCDGEFDGDVPIGRPVPNSVAYVADVNGRALPAGFIGELWIGGDCLADGYIGLPEMTAERFVDDPFSEIEGAKIYKTGDQVWADERGRLRYVGRRDRQVKVRGFRIELDEVEDALNAIDEVEDAAVKVTESAAGGAEIVAFIAPKVDASKVLEQLSEALPSQMVPTRFVGMDELPVTINGKIDYKSLPESLDVEAVGEVDVPDDPLVEAVLEEMREALKVPTLGVGENFFVCGGHSLRMMELITALERRGLQVSPEEFLLEPTAEGLAEAIRRRKARPVDESEWSPLKPLREVEDGPVLIFPHSTPGDVMGYGNLINRLGAGISCYGLVARGVHENLEPHDDLKEMAAYYADAILAELDGPYHLCGWCFGGMLALEIAQQLRRRGGEVGRLVLIDTEVPPMPGLGRFRAVSKIRVLGRFPVLEIAKYLVGKLPGVGGGEVAVDPHERDTDVYRINESAYDAYVGERYPGHVDEIISGINLWDGLTVLFSDDKKARAAESVERFDVNGDHMSLMREPVVADVAARLRELLLGGSGTGEGE